MTKPDLDAARAGASDAAELRLPLPFREFVALIAVMMALTALSIDIMLPGLPDIGAAMGVASENDRQLVVIIYMLGFALGQIVYGPLSDRHGRKPVLLIGFGIYILASLGAILAPTFDTLLVARALQGVGAASPRVMSLAIVRDVTSGRRMARVMSLAMAFFIIIPVFAPAMGQGLMALGTWRTPFDLLLAFALATALWIMLRLPETSAAGHGVARVLPLRASVRAVVTNRQTVAYAAGAGCLFGALLGYVASSQQIFVDLYGLGVVSAGVRRDRVKHGSGSAGERATGRAAGDAAGVARQPGWVDRRFAAAARRGGGGYPSTLAFRANDGGVLLPVWVDTAELQCARDGAARGQRRHGFIADRILFDGGRRRDCGGDRAYVRRECRAARDWLCRNRAGLGCGGAGGRGARRHVRSSPLSGSGRAIGFSRRTGFFALRAQQAFAQRQMRRPDVL